MRSQHTFSVLVSLFFVSLSFGATIHVPDDYGTIQAAINAAGAGDTVSVAAGTYVENITMKDGVALIGAGPNVCKIDGDGAGRMVTCTGCGSDGVRLEGFTITDGDAEVRAGGMYILNSTAVVVNCVFSWNRSQDYGGAMVNEDSFVSILGCTFSNNRSECGGGILNRNSSINISDCTFTSNFSIDSGGALRNTNNSSVQITRCSFTENRSDEAGGIYCENGTDVTITDCLFVQNVQSHIIGDYNDGGGNSIDENTYVDGSGKGHYYTIQKAINASVDGDTIVVMPDTYYENINMLGKAITLQSSDPANPEVIESTIISGRMSGAVITCNSGETTDTVITGFIIIFGSGAEIVDGHGNIYYCGGGMYNEQSSPTISNCTFMENRVEGKGGAIYNEKSSPIISHCLFINNYAYLNGGALYNNNYSFPTITDCEFIANSTDFGNGSVMYNYEYSVATIENWTAYANEYPVIFAGYYGGVIDKGGNDFKYYSAPKLVKSGVPGDINGSGTVDLEDFAIIANQLEAIAIIAENWLVGVED